MSENGKERTYQAQLIRGKNYTLMVHGGDPRKPEEMSFKKGETRIVPESVKALLEEQAVDHVTIKSSEGTEEEVRPKFKFTPVGESIAPTPARTRQRQVQA